MKRGIVQMVEAIPLTTEMVLVLGVLGLALFLFVSEIIRIDVAAILIMLLIGLIGQLPGIIPLIEPDLLFTGFSSNAVLSIIAIMILGAGLDKTGLMATMAAFILKMGKRTERRIVARTTTMIGLISGFMQNIGATALFLPVVSRIASHTQIPLSRLLIPTGFCAILGGTLTMVGCSSLIILNDLLVSTGRPQSGALPPIRTFELFDVTPIGLVLLSTGVAFFSLFGKMILPTTGAASQSNTTNMSEYLEKTYGLNAVIFQTVVADDSPIAGKTIRQIEDADNAPHILSLSSTKEIQFSPNRDDIVWPGSKLLLLGPEQEIRRFANNNQLELTETSLRNFNLISDLSGFSEVVIPPGSRWIGHQVGDIRLRKHYNASLLGVHRTETTLQHNLRGLTLKAGDTLILFSRWKDLTNLAKSRDFVVASDYPKTTIRPHKLPHALAFFAIAMGLVLFTDVQLAFALLTGAIGMVIFGVLSMDEAYHVISWKTVFLLASLIPLGMAVEHTGTAAWIANQILLHSDGVPVWGVQTVLAVLATGFTLIMSNVGATVLLVPIAINLAANLGADPTVFALTVALATSNSFLIPTHQVNALIMGPAGYRVADFTRTGSIMTCLYLMVLIPMINWVF
jgi:di/tricarboxylate transporter